ncbi:centrosomal protein of 68 kDa isoform X2 [Lacerta agilis]|uniref:centrosomal protein of 68 kDa isoform X2 n=1 Tax=Lacerta agilis TaxID=80427 RepID=UPI001419B3DA|nr:centrosomal protein of 68 kDa isoform X2 [Lacerta agilis]
MALEVEKSPFEASLSAKAKCYGRWNYRDLETDHSELVSKVCQPSAVEEEEPLPKETGVRELKAIEKADHTFPGIFRRTEKCDKMSSMASNKFCKMKAKAKYVERRPLISRTTFGSEVAPSFSRGCLFPEEQQQVTSAEDSDSAETLQGLLEITTKAMDSTFYSPTTKPLYNLDADGRSQVTFAPYSSTPKHLPGKIKHRFDAVTPAFPRTSFTLQPSEDSGFDQQGMARSKSFLGAGALSFSPETSTPWQLYGLPDPSGNHILGPHGHIALDSSPTLGHMGKMSSFQADYWACAIPDCLPPSPDRQSPHWDPNKEYEDLLDYTYPLRPKHKLAKNPKESSVHDSGVDLNSLSISPESTLKSMNLQGQEPLAAEIPHSESFPTPLLEKSECPVPVSHYRLSPVGNVSFSDGVPSPGRTRTSGEKMVHGLSPMCPRPVPFDSYNLDERLLDTRRYGCLTKRDADSSNFIRSTRVLPLQNGSSIDEEYLSLPPRLKELETLAQQLTDLSLIIRNPEHFPYADVNGEQLPLEVQGDGGASKCQWETDCDSCRTCSFHEHIEEDLLSNQSCQDQERLLGEAASSIDLLKTRFLESGGHRVEQETNRCRDSLALHIREFKKDLADHQTLTENVLQDGDRLLKCMVSDSPVLQNTLGLIAKQSDRLESHAERLYETLLAAMDTLGDGLIKNCDAQQTAAQAESSR